MVVIESDHNAQRSHPLEIVKLFEQAQLHGAGPHLVATRCRGCFPADATWLRAQLEICPGRPPSDGSNVTNAMLLPRTDAAYPIPPQAINFGGSVLIVSRRSFRSQISFLQRFHCYKELLRSRTRWSATTMRAPATMLSVAASRNVTSLFALIIVNRDHFAGAELLISG